MTRTSPSSRSKSPETTRPSLRARFVTRNALVDVAVRVENVFEKPVEPPEADAVELRADLRPLAAELVAVAAVRLEDLGAASESASAFDRTNPTRRAVINASVALSAGGKPWSRVFRRSARSGTPAFPRGPATRFSWSTRADALPAATASSSATAPALRVARPAAIDA